MQLDAAADESDRAGPLQRLDARLKLVFSLILVVGVVATPVGWWRLLGVIGLVLAHLVGLSGANPRRLLARWAGFLAEAHYSIQGSVPEHSTSQGVSQGALDYENGPFRVGYAGIAGKAPAGSPVNKLVYYSNFYANYDYGMGKVYAVYIRSNNQSTTPATPASAGTLNNGGNPLGTTGALVTGTDTGANTLYDISQISIDYRITPTVRVGALYGRIKDDSGGGKNADGWGIGAYWDVTKEFMVYGLGNSLSNDPNAGFRPSGSAGLTKTFTLPADVNGQTIRMGAFGAVYKF